MSLGRLSSIREAVGILYRTILVLFTNFVAQANTATGQNCTQVEETVEYFRAYLRIGSWIQRGICLRAGNVNELCMSRLETTLANLSKLQAAEYNGATGVLVLLPTIGVLLGAPTTEIWRLWTVMPFGGGLAIALSFGGAILPVRVEDYEKDLNNDKTAPGNVVSLRARGGKAPEHNEEATRAKVDQLVEKIEARMRQDDSQRLPRGHLISGLCGMGLLFVGAQAAMGIVEQGGVLPWWCVSRWWMHLWYLLVTFSGTAEAWAQVPFQETWKLFVSDIPYDVTTRNGDSIIIELEKPHKSVTHVLRQLGSLRAGTPTFRGSQQHIRPRNAVLVMVSVISNGNPCLGPALRLFSKCASIATFVMGTAFFTSTQLLALPVAVMTLTLVLGAGVFSRAIAGWIVHGVNKTEPMLHVIVNSTQEAQHVIARILSLNKYAGIQAHGDEMRKIQVEIDGHVFVKQRRVAYRTPWYLRTLGVLAEPFDLRKVGVWEPARKGSQNTSLEEIELGLLRT